MNQKKEMFTDLTRALEVMRMVDEKTPKNIIFYAMWLLENKQLRNTQSINVSHSLLNDENHNIQYHRKTRRFL